MKKLFSGIAFIFIFSIISVYPQGEAAVPFLTIPVSPAQNSMGHTGSSLPNDDPYGFLLNPAQLGFTSQTSNLSFMFYPGELNWFGFEDFVQSGMALNLGYNFKDLIGVPLSVGFGFANPELSYGTFISEGPYGPLSFESKDYYNAYSLGAGIDYGVQFYAGITLKDITSELGLRARAEAIAFDYGFLLNIPVLKLLDDKFTINLINKVPDKAYFDFSLGMATSNIGDEIYYIDPGQADPLPRSVRFGYGVSLGLDLYFKRTPLNAFDLAFTVDARDILVERKFVTLETSSGGIYHIQAQVPVTTYQSGLGDIDLWKNVIQIQGDDMVRSMAGLQISLMETFILRRGHLSSGYEVLKTNGLEFRLKGLLKLLDKFSDDPIVEFFADHFDLRYVTGNYLVDQPLETKFEGIILALNGFRLF